MSLAGFLKNFDSFEFELMNSTVRDNYVNEYKISVCLHISTMN